MNGSEWIWRVLVGGFLLSAALETFWPGRTLVLGAPRRWFANISLYVLAIVLVALWPAAGALAGAAMAEQNGWGLFPALSLPFWARLVLGTLLMDLGRYGVHRLEHANGWLWRLHEVHHSDPDMDVTTSFRFHPLSVIARGAADALVVVAFGIPAIAVFVTALTLGFWNYFSHINFSLPPGLERLVRTVFISPDTHRVHHAVDEQLQQSNFGVIFSFWDRIFGTWREPVEPVTAFGVREVEPGSSDSLPGLLIRPFQRR